MSCKLLVRQKSSSIGDECIYTIWIIAPCTIGLALASKAHAFMQGRSFVTPQDVKDIGFDVLRHRIIASYEAEAEDITTDDIIKTIFETVPVP